MRVHVEPTTNSDGHEPADQLESRPDITTLTRAITQTLAYSDIFDYPLTASEIHRYLSGPAVSRAELDDALRSSSLERHISQQDGFFSLPGREANVQTRQRRMQDAARLWRHAIHYGRMIAGIPFVRMVAVTGELASDNVGPHSDIDYFIVTEPGRLWLCRLLIISIVRRAAPHGLEICPNYLLSEQALEIDDRNLYTAREMAQMVPICGLDVYDRLRQVNGWVDDYLPNAAGPPRLVDATPHDGGRRRARVEMALRTRPAGWAERWEMERKVRKLSAGNSQLEASFARDWCKGHVDTHGHRILAAYDERCRAMEEQIQ